MEKIKFQIEIKRVLDVLSKEIYDSPYALLRENVQNAYDAILMREEYTKGEWTAKKDGLIIVQISREKIIIIDNGVGMPKNVLKENYWKAGSSGKHTELAQKSGVIGTFGIGGMANFGVCSNLLIETESIESKERTISEVDKAKLSLSEDCINIEPSSPLGQYGTKVIVTLDPSIILSIDRAREYLSQFSQYLPTRVELNGINLSQKSMEEKYDEENVKLHKIWKNFEFNGVKADVSIKCDYNGRVATVISNISISDEPIRGLVYLRQDSGPLWGFRSSFGLAPIPLSSFYSLGGIINLSILIPTAGREALTRESIEIVTKLINLIEESATLALSESEISNRSSPFMSYVLSKSKISLAGKLQPRVEPNNEFTLEALKEHSKNRTINYYDGYDEAFIRSWATPDKILVVLSRTSPRRQVELQFIQTFCKAEKLVDKPQITKKYSENEYEMEEISFVLSTRYILEEDYALQNADVKFADLTHGLALFASSPSEGTVEVAIQRHHSSIEPVLACYKHSRDTFLGFIKDYVRVYIYPQIRPWVPSSTKEGADLLQKILKKKRELIEINANDIALTSTLSEFLAGKITFTQVISKFNATKTVQRQEIVQTSIGQLENVIPDLIENPIKPPNAVASLKPQPQPAILRTDVVTDKKLLIVDKESLFLNNFKMFLAISERAFREEYAFFIQPHTTRIMWGGNRIIFIFTHASSQFSLYYDIELFEDVGGGAGGNNFPTTTIVTKNRIFIPLPDELKKYFEITADKKERHFYVRFDPL